MSKKRVTLTLSEDNLEWLDSVCNNRSGYVNDILAEARKGDYDTQSVLTAFEQRKLELERQQLESKLKAVREAEQELESMEQQQERETWERALQNITPPDLRSIDTEDWAPEENDDAVKHYAAELNMTPAEFVEQYPDKREELTA
jgi:uncharacterized membrane-anchored protein